jgi:type IV pilus assembly protein PilQ
MRERMILLFLIFLFIHFSIFSQEEVIPVIKFKDADIKVVLQTIAEKAYKDGKKVNIVISPKVEGLVTVSLENVEWQEALKVILKAYGYGYEWIGDNIILVATLEELAERRKKEVSAKEVEPLETKVFTLNFAKVGNLKEPITKLLTERGRLTIDESTNSLIITDTQSNLEKIKKSLKELDTITPQVLIEAKVIETDLDVTRNLGIKWTIKGTAAGSKRVHLWPFTRKSKSKYMPDNFPNVDTVYSGSNLANVFTFGTLDASQLSVIMEALFEDKNTKIISAPKITTLDNHTATIDVVTQDPVPNYTYNSETGEWEISGFEWKEYGVMLKVTPQINKEGYITLEISPEISDKLSDKTFSAASGSQATIPVIYNQRTSTKVMVKDGETLVIGGLIREKNINDVFKVPILGDLPIIGRFFKYKSKTKEKKDLLIFITPHIVTPGTNVQ